jgi:hypothetical protein
MTARRNRRSLAPVAAALGLLALAPPVPGQEVPVPFSLQVRLLSRVAGYDRNLVARSGPRVLTLILAKRGSAESHAGAAQLLAALKELPAVAGLPHEEEVVSFTGAPELAELCRTRRPAIVYLTPGFGDAEATAIGAALAGLEVLTVSADPGHVRNGAVLGFDVVSGRAKLLIDLAQASRQGVAFSADLLNLMVVYR